MMQDGRENRSVRGIWVTSLLLVVFLVLCIAGARWRGTVLLHRVVVNGCDVLPASDVVMTAGVPVGTPLSDVNLLEVRRRLMSEPFIREAIINREYPDIIRIRVAERTPVASLNCGQLLYVDTAGVLLPPARASARLDLPVISGIAGLQNSAAGQVCSNEDLFEALSIVRLAATIDSGMMHFISEINMNKGGDIDLFPADANVRIVLGRGDIGRKLVVLQAFWHTFIGSMNPEQDEYIDLRFDDEVVVKRRDAASPRVTPTM